MKTAKLIILLKSQNFVAKLCAVAIRRKEYQEDAKLRVFQILNENPQMTTRKIAQKVGISNGSAYYLLTLLIDMGFVKLSNFKDSSQKIKYSYLLTPKGIRVKSLITNKFLVRKKQEFEALRKEINSLEKTFIMFRIANVKMFNNINLIGVQINAFGHLGDVIVHFNLSPPIGAKDFLGRESEFSDKVARLACDMNGSFAAEHGLGRIKTVLTGSLRDPVE